MDNQPMNPNGAPRPTDPQTPPVPPASSASLPQMAPVNPQEQPQNQTQEAPVAPAQLNLSPDPKALKARAKAAEKAAKEQAKMAQAAAGAQNSDAQVKKPGLWEKMNTGTSIIDIIKAKLRGESTKSPEDLMIKTVSTMYEVNLVPDVKAQMIRALKIRNLVLFICLIVSGVALGITAFLFSIKSGQDIAMHNQDGRLETLSGKLTGFAELGELVTIQGQLSKISDINQNKTMVSRVFGALNASMPNSVDTVQFSEVRIDLSSNAIRLEGQTNANKAPDNDYRVLEEFKKAVGLVKYDYGRYVDAQGNDIPTWCIVEADENGEAFKENEDYYVWWDLTADGCAGSQIGVNRVNIMSSSDDEEEASLFYSENAELEVNELVIEDDRLMNYDIEFTYDDENNRVPTEESLEAAGIESREENGRTVRYLTTPTRVKIWRTPRFNTWYNSGNMTESGIITNVEHFESQCTKYSGLVVGRSNDGTTEVRWTSENNCNLVSGEGLSVNSSSNGRDESDNLVLKFSASMSINEEFFLFRNKHMIAIGPSKQNVTDSYLQIGGMFTRSAEDCLPGDTACTNNTQNSGGSN